ncbi:MAG: M48 family metallopeptidase [Cyanobacteria bacterium Co-bin8]|nr:M48 family metallopeptidase [Cyanobacteria bacterium Co-bin8]
MADSTEQLDLFSARPQALPDYQIRESARARHVSIKISLQGAVEVVVPKGFDPKRVPDIIQRRREWILKTVQRVQGQQIALEPDHFDEKPSTIELRSRHETWHILYQSTLRNQLTLTQTAPLTLTLKGPVDDPALCSDLLRQWLTRKARAEFAPWLRELSFVINLPFSRISVRGQKTRWASCSTDKNISLNYKLLFLPPPLVHYVFVHELCHTIHMDHSRNFWRLVGEKLPEYRHSRDELREAWRYVPRWVEQD